jgi:hypothetical protein
MLKFIAMQDYNDELELMDEFEYEAEYEMFVEYEDDEVLEFADGEDDNELAHELLTVASDEEMDQFLGKLVRGAWRGIRRFSNSRQGRNIRGAVTRGLKRFGRKVVPTIGRNVGDYFGSRYGGPRGGHYGGRAGQAAGNWLVDRFGWNREFEFLSPEEQELELAKKVVKVAKTAAKVARKLGQSSRMPPKAVAKKAIKTAIRKHLGTKKLPGSQNSGRWVRRGNRIVIMGA